MKLDNNLFEVINSQTTIEYYSAYLYLSMSANCEKNGYKGFANWMQIQAKEELAHAMHLYQYLLERGETPRLQEIKAPPHEFESLRDIFQKALNHEQQVTESINRIATLALQKNDHAAYAFIQWYVTEQVEEEASAEEILHKLSIIGDNLPMRFALDAEMSTRIYIDPFGGPGTT